MRIWGITLVTLLALSGCSSQATPSPTLSETPKDVKASFRSIVDASCSLAQTEGVVEVQDGQLQLVMVPKAQAYKDFSAVYEDLETKETQLIYETDAFISCMQSNEFALYEENGSTDVPQFTLNFENGQFVTTEVLDDTTMTYKYTVVGGLISSGSYFGTGEKPISFTVKYGPVGDANLALLKKAVDDDAAAE